MRKVLQLALTVIMGVCTADAAVRDANTIQRNETNSRTTNISQRAPTTTARTSVPRTRARTTQQNIITRTNTTSTRNTQPNRTARTATTTRTRTAAPALVRTASVPRQQKNTARATITLNTTQSNTFGTGYNTCRDAYFTCMDQFCATANDTYRRCICSSKLQMVQERERALSQASDKIQDFHDLNLSVINKTANEVQALLSASAGELIQSATTDKSSAALQLSGISDVLSKSKSKSLSTQGTLDIAGDINSIWTTTDLTGGVNIANLTGEALYNAVHAQCANITIDKCPDQSTQKMVISAYGMYIENDCSLVLNGLDKKLTSANGTIRATEREMNLARLENYNTHNSATINDCMALVRQDITKDTACGPDYVHCLDITGLYLSYNTGEPIYTPNFYQLESQVSLAGDILTNQTNRLLIAKLNAMRPFASGSLDTCRDLADEVWDEFMRQAITEIYQAQHARIRQVKNECMDIVNTCYDEQTQSLKDFSNTDEQLLLGARLELAEQMCQEKLNACANLYGGGTHGMQALLTTMHEITNQQIGLQCRETLTNFAKNICAIPGNDTIHAYPYTCRVYSPGSQQYASILACNQDTNNIITSKDPLTASPNASNTGANHIQADYTKVHNPETPEIPEQDVERPEGTTSKDYTCTKKYTSCPAGSYMAGPSGTDYNGTPVAGNTCIIGGNTLCTYPGGTAAPICAYTSCAAGYYMTFEGKYNGEAKKETIGNQCTPCPADHTCAGRTYKPCPFGQQIDKDGNCTGNNENTNSGSTDQCGTDYVGSLYHKLVRYAMQTCVRPSESNSILPTNILQDVNVVMTQLRTDMSNALSRECERLGGIWVDTPWVDNMPNQTNETQTTSDGVDDGTQSVDITNQANKTKTKSDGLHDVTGQQLYTVFYAETSANTQWGFCASESATMAQSTP